MERNLRLDYFRLFLSILVITIHCQPLLSENSLIGWLISNGIARIAVPCFFIISGYYIATRLDDQKALRKYMQHIGIVYLVWSLIYVPTYIQDIEPRSLITFALMGYYHLWFLSALIWGIAILYILKKFIQNDHILLGIAIVIYMIGYSIERLGYGYRVYNNGIFFGFPFIVAGYYICKVKIIEHCTAIIIGIFFSVSLLSLFVESYISYQTNMHYNIFISLFTLCSMLFIVVIKGKSKASNNNYIAKTATGIYYIHILIIVTIVPLSQAYNIYKYPIIVILSVLAAIFVLIINKRIKILL